MKNKKVYLIIAYMFIVLALTFVIVNTQALAIESNAEGNNVLNTNVNTEKTTFKAKVKYKNFPLFDENNPIIRKEILVGLTKNGVDLGVEYEKKVSTRYDEVELVWDNLEKYTVENGIQKENVYEIKLKTNRLSDGTNEKGEPEYEAIVKSNEIVVTSNVDIKDFYTTIEFKNFKPGDEKPIFRVELVAIKGRSPYESYGMIGEEYDKTVDAGNKDTVSFEWKNIPVHKIRHVLRDREGSISYKVRIKYEDLKNIDKNKYEVLGDDTHFNIIKKEQKVLETGEIVEIKDPEFRKLLNDHINNFKSSDNKKALDEPIYKHELEKIVRLGIEYDGVIQNEGINSNKIKSLEGIENLTNLESIILGGVNNDLIKELYRVKNLKYLKIEKIKNKKIDGDAFKGLDSLEELEIGNPMKEYIYTLYDLSFLKHLKNLKSLKIENADIKNLDDIKDSSIKKLSLNVKDMPSITPIVENKNIEELEIRMTRNSLVFSAGTPEEKKNAKIDMWRQMYSYLMTKKEMSREQALKYIIEDYKQTLKDDETLDIEKYIKEYLSEQDDLYKIKNLNEISKMKQLKKLTLVDVGLENIEGISKLSELENLIISSNTIADVNELLKLEKLKEAIIDESKIYDKRKIKDLIDKGIILSSQGRGEYTFLVNPKKFTLPDLYDENGNKFDLFAENNELDLLLPSDRSAKKYLEIYESIKNFIKKNEDGTYSYIYKPYELLRVIGTHQIVNIYPINTDYNDQDLSTDKDGKKYKIDKSKIVKFKNPHIKEYILKYLKTQPSTEETLRNAAAYVKNEDENDVYEDELKYVYAAYFSGPYFSNSFAEKIEKNEDLSDLVMFPNIEKLSINSEIENIDFIKELKNLKELELTGLGKEQHLPRFKENNKIIKLTINGSAYRDNQEKYKEDILENNLNNLQTLKLDYFMKNSFIGLEKLKSLIEYNPLGGSIYNRVEEHEGKEFNIHYDNKKVVTERTINNFDKEDDETLNIELPFKPTTKRFRINILDKVNNKNIEIIDPALKKNEDGTYELLNYSKKIQDITFELDGRKVTFKIDITKIPLTSEEESQIQEEEKEYNVQEILSMIKNNDNNYLKVKKLKLTLSNLKDREIGIWDYLTGPGFVSSLEEGNRRDKEENVNTFDLLKLFPNIEELTIINNEDNAKIVDPNLLNWKIIRELKHLKKLDLTKLYSYKNDKTFDFSNIEGIQTLEELKIKEGRFSNNNEYNIVNLEKIATLKNLKVLEMANTNLNDISALENLTKLKYLDLGYNNIKNIDALKNLNELESLMLSNNNLENIDALKEKEKLKILDISENKISNISVLEKSKKITDLYINGNNIENVDVLRNFKRLKTLTLIDNQKIKDVNGLKESLKENSNSRIVIALGNNNISDNDIVDLTNINPRVVVYGLKSNYITYKPKKNKFDIDLFQNGLKLILSNSPFFRDSGLIKNEDGTYSFKDYKNSEIIRLTVGNLITEVSNNKYDIQNMEYKPYYYVYIDPSEIREEDKVVPTPEKEEENPKEENKVEEKVEDKISEIHEKPELTISKRKLPYAGMQDDTMLKVLLVLVAMYTIASFNLYKKGLEKKNDNK